MNTYPSYKDSGVEWIGDIPSGWESIKLKYIFHEKPITHNSGLGCGSISFGRVVYKDDDKIPVSTKESYQEVLKGEYLINPLNLNYDLKSLRISLSSINVVVSSGYIVIKNSVEINKSYYKWLLHIYDIKHMKLLGSGVRQTISFNHISNSILTSPPLQEQQQISYYLDYKTSKIDTLIEKAEQKIELLKEQRTSLINTTVTKGLNPNVEMKGSGVEWIGEIPSGWDIKKLKYIGNLYGGLTGKSGKDFNSEDSPHNKPFIPFTNIFNNVYISDNHFQYVNIEPDERQNRVIKNDLFFLMSSEDYDDLGKSSILTSEVDELYLNSFCKGFRVEDNKINPLFVNYQLLGNIHRKLISIEGKGFTRINLRQDKLNNTYMFIPPLQEQQQIVDYLDKETSKIDKLVAIESKRVKLLKEYRQSLISEVVTGKVDVRNEVLV